MTSKRHERDEPETEDRNIVQCTGSDQNENEKSMLYYRSFFHFSGLFKVIPKTPTPTILPVRSFLTMLNNTPDEGMKRTACTMTAIFNELFQIHEYCMIHPDDEELQKIDVLKEHLGLYNPLTHVEGINVDSIDIILHKLLTVDTSALAVVIYKKVEAILTPDALRTFFVQNCQSGETGVFVLDLRSLMLHLKVLFNVPKLMGISKYVKAMIAIFYPYAVIDDDSHMVYGLRFKETYLFQNVQVMLITNNNNVCRYVIPECHVPDFLKIFVYTNTDKPMSIYFHSITINTVMASLKMDEYQELYAWITKLPSIHIIERFESSVKKYLTLKI